MSALEREMLMREEKRHVAFAKIRGTLYFVLIFFSKYVLCFLV